MPEETHTMREPLPQLRWNRAGLLEQGWKVTKYLSTGAAIDAWLEWVVVPSESEK